MHRRAALALVLITAFGCDEDATTIPVDTPPPFPEGVFEFSGVDVALPTTDLEPLWALVGDARLVGLGESVHTSGGFYAAKNRLIRALVEQRGFRVLAMETPRTWAENLEEYLQAGECDAAPNAVLTYIFGVYGDDNTMSLMKWICERNATHPDDRVHFFGFDMQQPEDDEQILRQFLAAYAAADAIALTSAFPMCSRNYSDLGPFGGYDDCVTGLATLAVYLDAHRDTLVAASSETTFRDARMAVASWRAWQDQVYYFPTAKSIEARDTEMAALFAELLATRFSTDSRVVIWGHDWHLEAAHQETGQAVDGPPAGVINFGTLVRREFGASYAPIALAGFAPGVNYPASGNRPPQYGPSTVGTEPGSAESRLHALMKPYLLVDPTSSVFPATQVLLGGEPMVVARQFAAVVYLDSSPPMDAAFW